MSLTYLLILCHCGLNPGPYAWQASTLSLMYTPSSIPEFSYKSFCLLVHLTLGFAYKYIVIFCSQYKLLLVFILLKMLLFVLRICSARPLKLLVLGLALLGVPLQQ